MNNNDVLRRIRYIFDYNDFKMIEIFGLAGMEVTQAQVCDWLKKDDAPDFVSCRNSELASFLNGLITEKRGKKDGPMPVPEKHLTNNLIFKKLRIAFNLKDEDILNIMGLVKMRISKPELTALFRKPGHKHYRECKDQFLRNFLQGLQLKFRVEPTAV